MHYVFKPDEDATYKHFKALTEATKFPVIIYNVVPWNYLSPALLVRIMKDMPGVIGVKQSAGDLKLMADLLINLPRARRSIAPSMRCCIPRSRSARTAPSRPTRPPCPACA